MTNPGKFTVGRVLHRITGQHHIEYLLGDCLLLFSAVATVYTVLDRLTDDDDDLRETFKPLERLIVLVVVALVAVFWVGHLGLRASLRHGDIGWMSVYWTLMDGTLMTLLAYACRGLLILRQDCRQRLIADLYLLSFAFGILCCIGRLSINLTPIPATSLNFVVRMLACTWMAGFALTSAYSWRQKHRALRGLPETVD
jgi:hypothetical protein